VKASTAIGLAGAGAALAIAATLQWQSGDHVTRAGFWFDEVTFELPHLQAAGLGGPIDDRERATIAATAWAEVQTAFAGLQTAAGGVTADNVREKAPGIRAAMAEVKTALTDLSTTLTQRCTGS